MPNGRRSLALVITTAVVAVAAPAAVQGADSNIRLQQILTGYDRPVLVTHTNGSSRTIFIVEQGGKIKRATFSGGEWTKLGTFLDISDKVNDPTKANNAERGLLGLAFPDDYSSSGRFYVNYTRRGSGSKLGDTVVAEYRRDSAAKADPDSERRLMVINQPFRNHNGGHLAFGPDGLLYIGTGDGGGLPGNRSQNLGSRLGKILRIDPRDPDGAGPRKYGIPGSNPRVGKSGRNELWAWGLRNPWRYSFDRKNGDLWIGDVGQNTREEINRSRSNNAGRKAGRAKNYGWARCEGNRRFPQTGQKCTFGTRPVHAYAHGNGRCSVTGGYVHRGPEKPGWRGLYVGADFCGRLFVLGSGGKVKLSKVTSKRITSFGEDSAGRIFATGLGGAIYLVRFTGSRP